MAKKRDKIKGGFVPMTWDMLNSQAYKALPASSAKVLPFFLGKIKDAWSPNDPVRYNTDFPFTYAEAKRLGFGKSTFRKMVRDLMKHGFINLTYHGHYKTAGPQASTLFRLSKRWQQYPSALFDEGDWRKHFPDLDPDKPKKKKSQVLKVNPISPDSEPIERLGRPL
jgi:hypothetical protein